MTPRRSETTGNAPGEARWRWLALFLAILSLGLLFQGTRGIWEPDEGFYANVALGMLDSHNWWLPRLNGEVFLDKPPMVYWSIASGMKLLGVGAWGARSGHALFFAGAALAAGLLAGRWWGRRSGAFAALAYATSFLPFLAANVLTPDTQLAFFTALSFLLYDRAEGARTGGERLRRGAMLGAALGLGALSKGPAILVMAAPLLILVALRRRSPWSWLADSRLWMAAVTFSAVTLSWYWLVCARVPGALAYILDNQVLGRLVTAQYQRNAQWHGSLRVYIPVLLVGALPWTPLLLTRLRGLSARLRDAWREPDPKHFPLLFVVLTFFVPLAIFMVARSRLPLYILPLWTPLALAAGRSLAASKRGARFWAIGAVGWVALLAAARLAPIHLPYDGKTDELARQVAAAGVTPQQSISSVDFKANALPLYGYRSLRNVTLQSSPYPFFSMPRPVTETISEVARSGQAHVFLVRQRDLDLLLRLLERARLVASVTPATGSDAAIVQVSARESSEAAAAARETAAGMP